MNSQTQMMSSACQNRAKQSRRRSTVARKPLTATCSHHHGQPDQSGGDVQPVAADKGEKGGKKRAALRGRRRGDHAGELAELESEERGAEHEGDQQQRSRCRARRRELIASDISPHV